METKFETNGERIQLSDWLGIASPHRIDSDYSYADHMAVTPSTESETSIESEADFQHKQIWSSLLYGRGAHHDQLTLDDLMDLDQIENIEKNIPSASL